VMGLDPKDGLVDLQPADTPTAYIDVLEQRWPVQATPKESWLSLCYATRHRTSMGIRGEWFLDLRAEGGGTYTRGRLLATFGDDGAVEVRLMAAPQGISVPA
jgi:hypothetical protein